MKNLTVFVLLLSCVLALAACGADRHVCRLLDAEEMVALQPVAYAPSFITDAEIDACLRDAIGDYLADIGEASAAFTYTIEGTDFGLYNGRETLLCWVKIVYGEGFTTVQGYLLR